MRRRDIWRLVPWGSLPGDALAILDANQPSNILDLGVAPAPCRFKNRLRGPRARKSDGARRMARTG
jgi:hypothetical protein